MKKTKRLVSLLLAFAMCFALAVPSAFAADFSDVPESYQYYDAVQSLVTRGVLNGYEDGTFRPGNTITRGEYAKMIIYAIGLDSVATNTVTETGFPDVSPEHWAAGVIKTAYDLGIINGFEDGTFRADENVTYDQALKMTVCAKYDKFGEYALANGGYPAGYRKVANSYGFIKGITDGVYEQPAKRGTIAKLIHNMLGIDLSKITDDALVPEENQVTEENGQVIAVYGVSLEPGTVNASRNQIVLKKSNGTYTTYSIVNLAVKENIRAYLGKLVTVYYTEDISMDAQMLTGITLQRNRNEETVVDFADLVLPASNTKVTYTDERGNIQEISVNPGAALLYNSGLAASGKTLTDLINENASSAGNLRLLSTSGAGGAADVVFVNAYTNYMVTGMNTSKKTVNLDNGSAVITKVLNEDDSSKTIGIFKNGEKLTFSAIAKNQFVSIAEDISGNYIEVLLGQTPFEGRVTSMTRDEGIITVASKTYEFAPGATFGADITVGANLKLYLDGFGKIAKYEFKATATNYIYAYLTQIKNFGGGINSDVHVELVNLNTTTLKSFTNYPLADSVSINGVNYTTATDFALIESALVTAAQQYQFTENSKTYGAAAGEVYQPMKYTLVDGKIATMLVGKPSATDADLRVDASTLDTTVYTNGIKCTTDYTGLAGGVFTLTSATKVLHIADNTVRTISNINAYKLKAGTNSGLRINNYYRVLLIDVNNVGVPAVVVVYADNIANVDANTNDWANYRPGVVTAKGSFEDYNNITVQGYNDNGIVYKDEGTTFYNQVAIGDIVRIAADANNVIEAMEVVTTAPVVNGGTNYIQVSTRQGSFDAGQFIDKVGSYARAIREGSNKTQDNAGMTLMAGTVYSYVDNNFKIALEYATPSTNWTEITLGNEGRLKSMTTTTSTKVIAVNMKNGVVQSIDQDMTLEEIIPYTVPGQSSVNTAADRVFVYRSTNAAQLIVVYRNI